MQKNFRCLSATGISLFISLIFSITGRGQVTSPEFGNATITAAIGGGLLSGEQPTKTILSYPIGLASDKNGNLYIADSGGIVHRINVLGSEGAYVVAGTLNALLSGPAGVAVDGSGNVYISEFTGHRIRKLPLNGYLTTVAGTGTGGFGGDGGMAVDAELNAPAGLAIDPAGNLYIADVGNNRIRKLSPDGKITTVAGNGTAGYNGDGIAAAGAALNAPYALATDKWGNLFIGERAGHRIRKIDTLGIITTITGTGVAGSDGDGSIATAAVINSPAGIVIDTSGDIFFTDIISQVIREIDTSGIITNVTAQEGTAVNKPAGITLDKYGVIYFAEEQNCVVRSISYPNGDVSHSNGRFDAVAGIYQFANYDGDGSTDPLSVVLYSPTAVTVDNSGGIYFPDNNKVRGIMPYSAMKTIAGTGVAGYSGDGGPADSAQIDHPLGVFKDAYSRIYIGSEGDHRIRKVDPSGIISTFAGNGTQGYSGDGGPAVNASIGGIKRIIGDFSGNIYFSDPVYGVVRRIDAAGIITTVAGTGTPGYSGDGGPAIAAQIGTSGGLTIDDFGNLYIGDNAINTVRKVDTSGFITTIAGGNPARGNTGDGGLAKAALFGYIADVSADRTGNLFIVDSLNNTIRFVSAISGIIYHFAGDGKRGYAGDGNATPVQNAEFNGIDGIFRTSRSDNLYVADRNNNRIRYITIGHPMPTQDQTMDQVIRTGSSYSFPTNIYDTSYNLICSIASDSTIIADGPDGTYPPDEILGGEVRFHVGFDSSVQTFMGRPYLPRHFDITPAVNPSTAQAMMLVYFTQADLDAYNDYIITHNLNLPGFPTKYEHNPRAPYSSWRNFRLLQFHGTGTTPGNYTGATGLQSTVLQGNWDEQNQWWELRFFSKGFSGFYFTTGDDPLPLTLLSFTGDLQNGDAILNWTVSNEVNTKNFIIERSQGPGAFTAIGTVGALSRPGTNKYSYTDNGLSAGIYYYRLKMQDLDGHYTYSGIVSIEISSSNHNPLILSPNPVKDILFVQVQADRPEKGILQLADMQGKVLQQQEFQLASGATSLTFNVAALAAGSYWIISSSGGRKQAAQFIKK